MAHKIDRIGQAKHLFETATAATPGLDLTGGGGITGPALNGRVINAVALSENGSSVLNPTGSSNLTDATRLALVQQVIITLPDAELYALEIWGELYANCPAGVLVNPVASNLLNLGTAVMELESMSRPLMVGPGAAPAGAFSLQYHATVMLNGNPLTAFAHGFEFFNATAGAKSCTVWQLRTGFRTLDTAANFKHYDPVR